MHYVTVHIKLTTGNGRLCCTEIKYCTFLRKVMRIGRQKFISYDLQSRRFICMAKKAALADGYLIKILKRCGEIAVQLWPVRISLTFNSYQRHEQKLADKSD